MTRRRRRAVIELIPVIDWKGPREAGEVVRIDPRWKKLGYAISGVPSDNGCADVVVVGVTVSGPSLRP